MLRIKTLFLLFITLLLPIENIAQENEITTGNKNEKTVTKQKALARRPDRNKKVSLPHYLP